MNGFTNSALVVRSDHREIYRSIPILIRFCGSSLDFVDMLLQLGLRKDSAQDQLQDPLSLFVAFLLKLIKEKGLSNFEESS